MPQAKYFNQKKGQLKPPFC